MAEDRTRIAAEHLKGHVVPTPLLGGIVLPGFQVPAGLRIKLEVLQPAATAEYRGFQYALLRQLGGVHGWVCGGQPRRVLAQMIAARSVRCPAVGFLHGVVPEDVAAWVQGPDLAISVLPDAAAVAAAMTAERIRLSYGAMPPLEDQCVQEGLATLGLELAAMLPAETEVVVVPAPLAVAVRMGLAAGGRPLHVHAAAGSVAPGLVSAVAAGLHVVPSGEGLAALTAALTLFQDRPACVVL